MVVRLRAAGCVFAEDEADILLAEARSQSDLERMLLRRVAGQPLESVVGWAEFCGLRVRIEPGVFVPRRRTEFLVFEALLLVQPGDTVVDLCCGSGAVALALAESPGIELYAADIDPIAARCARDNLGDRAEVSVGDLYEALPRRLRGRVDLLTVNAPYVPSDRIRLLPPEARIYEPRATLDGGEDGLDLHRRIAREALDWLRPGGSLLIETSVEQAETTAAILRAAGLVTRIARSEERDATVAIARHPGAVGGALG